MLKNRSLGMWFVAGLTLVVFSGWGFGQRLEAAAKAKPHEEKADETTEEAADKDSSHVLTSAVVDSDWKYDGTIVGAKDQHDKSMYSLEDIVYLDIGKADGLIPGLHCAVYRKGDPVKDSTGDKTIGYQVTRLGVVEVTKDIDENRSSAKIVESLDSIEIGDLVKKEGDWVKP